MIGPFMYATVRFGLDGAWAGANNNNSYFAVTVDPGVHHLCVSWQSTLRMLKKSIDVASFTAEPGKVYYFAANVKVIPTGNNSATMISAFRSWMTMKASTALRPGSSQRQNPATKPRPFRVEGHPSLIITRDALSPRHSGVKAARQGPQRLCLVRRGGKADADRLVLPSAVVIGWLVARWRTTCCTKSGS